MKLSRSRLKTLPMWAGLMLGAALPSWSAQAAQEAAPFDIFEYRVEGATLLSAATVERAVYPYLGEKKTVAEVESARAALERAYHDAGWLTALVHIPQQKVSGAVVRLNVIEAPVERLRVVGARYYRPENIKAAVPELAEGHVPYFPTMQQQLARLNRAADRKVAPVLKPGRTPGTLAVDLDVEDRLPLHGSLELNDRQSAGTTPTRLNAGIRWDNLWQRQHSLGLTLQTAPELPEESRVAALTYSWPRAASGDIVAVYGVSTRSDVTAVDTIKVLGRGSIAGLRYIHALGVAAQFFSTATLGVDYKDFDQTVGLSGGGGFDTPIRYLPFSLAWDGSWPRTKLNLSLNFHLRGLVAEEQDFADKRFKGRPNYAFLRANASRTQTWGRGWGLGARLGGQFAAQPLIANEQYALGGTDTVRGYFESAALGDSGAHLGLEAFTPRFAFPGAGLKLTGLQFLVFAEGGQARVIEPLPGQAARLRLAGAGLGLRVQLWKRLALHADGAVALYAVGQTREGDGRAHLRLAYEW